MSDYEAIEMREIRDRYFGAPERGELPTRWSISIVFGPCSETEALAALDELMLVRGTNGASYGLEQLED